MEMHWPALSIKHSVTTGSQRCEEWCAPQLRGAVHCVCCLFSDEQTLALFFRPEAVMMKILQISVS